MGFQTYMENVRSQLTCNNTEEERDFIVFDYSQDFINSHRVYFMRSMVAGLSPYKALTFFSDWLEDQKCHVNQKS